MDNPTGQGQAGTDAQTGGGGGGGSGTAGGAGGLGQFGGGDGGDGGSHGEVGASLPTIPAQGSNGGNGGDRRNSGGGAGGGGAGGFGAVVTGRVGGTVGVTATGGDGGYAGTAFQGVAVGGSGGVGLYFTDSAAGSSVMIGARVTGGTGGNGNATGNPNSGGGGDGGAGIMATGVTLIISPGFIVRGGDGGSSAFRGRGGVGIGGSDLTIANNGGTISGGLPGAIGSNDQMCGAAVTTRACAVQLTGGTNYVGTGGTITGGINVMDNAMNVTSFQPALPGSPVGTPLVVNGPIAFAPGTFYNVRITPTTSDSVTATGAASLNGTVRVVAGYGTYTARPYRILTAAGGFGGTTFAGVTSNFAFLMPMLTYVGNDVILTIQAGTASAPPVIATNGTPVPDYRYAAKTQNQRAVATGLTEAGILNGGKGPILNAFNQLTVAQAQVAFDSLSGEGITATQNIANRSSQLFTSSIFDQTTFYGGGGTANQITLTEPLPDLTALAPEQTLGAARAGQPVRELADLPASRVPPVFVAPARTWRAWATGFGGVEDIHGNTLIGSARQDNTIYGGALGVDYQLRPNLLVGVALGGSNGDFRVAQRATSGSTTGGHVALYEIYTQGALYGASSIAFSEFDNKTNRLVGGFGGLNGETLRGNFNSDEVRGRFELGRHFVGLGRLGTVTPFAALEVAELTSRGFGETSVSGRGLFRLNVAGQSALDLPGFVGLRFQNVMPLGGLTFLPTLQVAYVHEFSPYRQQTGTLADLPGATFLVDGARPARNAAQVKAGGELRIGPNSSLFANFDGEFSGMNQLYAGKGGFRWVW